MDIKKLQDTLSKAFLKDILKALRANEVSVADSKKMAQDFLKLEPYASVDEAKQKISEYIALYPRFHFLETSISAFVDAQNTDKVISLMQKHLQNDDVDKALEVATKPNSGS